jgi:hypothetical protein
MRAKRVRWVVLATVLGVVGLLVCLSAPETGRAEPPAAAQSGVSWTGQASMLAAAGPPSDGGVRSLSDSSLEVQGNGCYEPNKVQTLCFTVYNGSPDAEWISGITVTFPSGPPLWDASCGSWDNVDSMGNPVHFTCGWITPGDQVFFIDNDIETPQSIGEISAGSSWGFCAQVDVPAGYTGPQPIEWELSGDEDGDPPHTVVGETIINECTPLMLNPGSVMVEGCNGVTQTLTFELWNHHAGNGTFDLGYYVTSGNATFAGPADFFLGNGSVVTFTVDLVPNRCVMPDEQVTAFLEATGNGQGAISAITQTVVGLSAWRALPYTSPVPSMDSAVVWASESDGGIWVIGGYGSNGATQRYNPQDGTWLQGLSEAVITPLIEYPMEGCYGLDATGDEIVVLFPDTIVTGSLHIYNITDNSWSTQPVPGWFPAEGRWGLDVVSMLNIPAAVKPGIANTNVCYLTGGADQPGGGRTRDLWVYYPDNPGGGRYIAPFPASIWFGFHASWYVPWVGEDGAICIAGGVDHNHQINNTTQCYDLRTGTFGGLNAALGPLPEPWWGMADGWQMYYGRYRIWMANGVAQDGTLLPISVYADELSGGFKSGPGMPIPMYRGEGTGYGDSFYVLNGSKGGFWYSHSNLLLSQCPWCNAIDLPLVVRDN